jgi:hypothetical protein
MVLCEETTTGRRVRKEVTRLDEPILDAYTPEGWWGGAGRILRFADIYEFAWPPTLFAAAGDSPRG